MKWFSLFDEMHGRSTIEVDWASGGRYVAPSSRALTRVTLTVKCVAIVLCGLLHPGGRSSPGETAAHPAGARNGARNTAAGRGVVACASVGDSDAWWFGDTALRLTDVGERAPRQFVELRHACVGCRPRLGRRRQARRDGGNAVRAEGPFDRSRTRPATSGRIVPTVQPVPPGLSSAAGPRPSARASCASARFSASSASIRSRRASSASRLRSW
jgi:hypothetical protein